MKSVMLSVKPYWLFLIIAKTMGWKSDKEKTVEVRKSYPKDKDWDKTVILYCTKDKVSFNQIPKKYQPAMAKFLGKVISKFVCDKITDCRDIGGEEFYKTSCMTYEDWRAYTDHTKNNIYAWHISGLKICDKPRELSEFKTLCTDFYDGKHCDECEYFIDGRGYEYDESDCGCDGLKPLKRPPQSWCYVEEL